eukprot:362927-Chlamydomonas_euryale.AAC.11
MRAGPACVHVEGVQGLTCSMCYAVVENSPCMAAVVVLHDVAGAVSVRSMTPRDRNLTDSGGDSECSAIGRNPEQ